MNRYGNSNIEPHAGLLNKPAEGAMLYKIIESKYLPDMIENKYLYFRRVDTYTDDKNDSDQSDEDKQNTESIKFKNSPDYTARQYYASI